MNDRLGSKMNGFNKPFRIGTVLSESFKAYFGNFFKFLIFALVLFIPLTAVFAGLTYSEIFDTNRVSNLGISPILVLASLAGAFFYMLTAFLIQIGIVSATIEFSSGRSINFSTMFERGVENIAGAIGISLILFAGMMGIMFLAFLAGGALSSMFGIGLLSIFIVVLSFIIIVALMTGASIAIPVLIAEEKGVLKSLKRSFELSKGRKWEMFGIFLITSVLYFIVAFLIQIGMALGGEIMVFASQVLIYVFSTSFFAVVVAVVYTNLRISKEGADTSEIAKVFQ
ncbi:hypothetical protein [Kordiimonas sp. SCSIO 12610]|uniref:hypothetical protein n=1 Tax=Kordiimonas sp. SCSIO 12610 TaxID=2829597 RepID=UPI002109E391|nr:hypothetical protein [Kordiimonas sp. SCSIO 12610]UTW56323.1 hypothetical protein KFF44_05315 [Kordiimonas sp. SCSIO 12610]